MASFQPPRLTRAGLMIQTHAQAGASLTFTRVQIGDALPSATYLANVAADAPLDMDDVVSPVREARIVSVSVAGLGQAKVEVFYDNRGATEPFLVRELGLFAMDPSDGQEKLYAYTNAGDGPDSVAADDGSAPFEALLGLMTIIGSARTVSASFDSQVWASVEQLTDHRTSTNTALAAMLALHASNFNRYLEGMLK